ncbi:MAG: Bax inhibitor-1/YccA family protein [Candidatus Marinimicrobia bacterium]|nr:Bax inhibitor-1/YccA family protein [Candidatus Neomarinimicrobiota bacterium]MCF7830043.1 Bax inhibitor-1/YccA family protein [Candidatus Neomarinimicrobiota bacterium]MCF7881917.1 Bax inhibitor-1/YccA family protein [Candidatus Neomarinimicrobiota bacterium]
MRTANPALNSNTFQNLDYASAGRDTMSLQGTVNRSATLLVLLMLPAIWTWNIFFSAGSSGAVMPYMIGGAIGGLIVALITVFKKTWSPITAPIYAVLEGLFLGGISAIFEAQYPGIVLQAVFLTFGTLFGLLAAYRTGLIQVTENFKLGVAAATGGIFLVYMLTWILGFFGMQIPFIHSSGLIGIGFSVFVVIIAALNLVLDFDFIESGVEAGAPRYMEWYASFGLLVTLVWLYLEILRLLAKLASRR